MAFVFSMAYIKYRWGFHSAEAFGAAGSTVGAFFSALAFAGVLAALFLQQHDIRATRDALAEEGFDRTFFRLLEMNRRTVESLSIQFPDEAEVRGRPALALGAERLTSFLTMDVSNQDGPVPTWKIAAEWYQTYCLRYRSDFGQYFRSLYYVLSYLDSGQSAVGMDTRRFYAHVLRSQLATSELLLLLANAQSETGRKSFLPLALKWQLFDNASWPREVSAKVEEILLLNRTGAP